MPTQTNLGQGDEQTGEEPGGVDGTGSEQPVRNVDITSPVRSPPRQSPPPRPTVDPVRQEATMPSSSGGRGGVDCSIVAKTMEAFLHNYALDLKTSNRASLDVALSPLVAIQAGHETMLAK